MKVIRSLLLLLVTPGFIGAQASPQKADSSANDSEVAAELKALREALSQTQKQMSSQQQEIEALRQQLGTGQPASVSAPAEAPQVINAALTLPDSRSASSYNGATTAIQPTPQDNGQGNRPLGSFNIGGIEVTPGGFIDLENIYRTTNTQNNIATNFGAIPFSNTTQGQLSEYRLTGQYSRFDVDVRGKFGANNVEAYCEADFSGNDAANVYQIVNGHTLRLRLCFLYLKRGKWEIMGGHTWSWLMPNRNGVSPLLGDLITTYNEDQDVQVGIPYTRAAEFRAAYHFNDHWVMGLGIEDPNQFTG